MFPRPRQSLCAALGPLDRRVGCRGVVCKPQSTRRCRRSRWAGGLVELFRAVRARAPTAQPRLILPQQTQLDCGRPGQAVALLSALRTFVGPPGPPTATVALLRGPRFVWEARKGRCFPVSHQALCRASRPSHNNRCFASGAALCVGGPEGPMLSCQSSGSLSGLPALPQQPVLCLGSRALCCMPGSAARRPCHRHAINCPTRPPVSPACPRPWRSRRRRTGSRSRA